MLKTVIFAFLLFTVFILITSRTDILGIRSMVVLTGSMEPSISVGSIIFVSKDIFYQTGEVISFKNSQGITITHRIIDKLVENGAVVFKTKGDANNTQDNELITSGSIIGKKVFVLPYLGRITAFLKTPLGFISLIITPALIFIAFEVFNIKKEMEKEIEKKLLQKISSG